jgi:uncharacterized lipoprotein YddW (UPF0748 family)/fibronectin type 3 domain-containing protein
VDRGVTTANFGEINPSNNDEMPAALIEIGFHTSPVDTDAIEDPEFRRIASRAVYQGIVKFYNDFYSFSDDTLLPEPPTNLRVLNASGGDVTVAWNAPPFNTGNDLLGDAATGYRVYLSSNGKGFDNGQSVTGTSTTLDSLTEGQVYYVRVTATNSGGESFPTETLAVRVHGSAAPPALIVNGFDRLDGGINVIEDDPYSTADNHRGYLWLMNTFDYSIAHAESLDAADIDFDSCANEAVISGQVNLDNYHTVIWILGNESTGDSTLDSTEQSEVSGFLGQGGSLFLSGTEVGWDLDAQNNGRTFYENTLHANYVADDAGTYTASGAGGSIFSGISLQFDDGSEIYNARMPDVIAANAGSSLAMNYTGAGSGGAATQWSGGSPTANVVMLGFPFETILDEAGRDALMEAVTDFFGTASGGGGDTTPPAAPTGLGATPGDGTVALDWSDNGEGDLAGYNIHRATATGGPYTQLNGSLLTGSDYSDNSVTNDTTYYYVVTAEDTSANESGNSSEVSATPTGSGGGATEVIVDNDDGSPSYTETGTWATSGSTGYDGGTYRFATSGGAHTATFTPTLTANGNYEVFVFHRAGSNRPTAAQFTVTASTGDETEAVDQTINSLQWVSIGTFNLNASTAKVVLNAATSTPTAQATISDAVRFLPAGGPDPSTEIRAVWASRFQWPGSSQSQTEGNLDDIFDDMESGNFNTLFLQVRGNMDTLYPSPNETWSPIFGESDPGYDPLDYAVTEAHSRGLELHAYINTHTIFDNPTPPSNQNHVFYDHGNVNDANNRDWLLHDGSGNPVGYTEYHWMNPGVPEADTWVRDQVLYVIDNYDVDGVHFDRARMPAIGYGRNPIAVARWDDPGTGTANDGPGNPDKLGWDDFMRDAITRSLVNIYGEAWALDSSVAFSSAPLGLYDVSAYPGYPSGFNYGYPRGQDAKAWMSEGAMDFIVPQIYWDDGGSLPDFSDLYFDWQDAADSAGRYLVPGSNNSNGQAEVENHALISRANGGAGHALWQVASTNYSDWSDPGGPYENPSSFADFTWRQTEGVIIGHVFESDGTTPVTDAWVTRIGDSHTALSSADGFYTFLRLAPGSFTVTASHPDHGTAQASGISVTAGNATVVNLTLTDEAPAAPANLGATPGDGSVSLDWDDNTEPDLDGYNVHRATSTGGPYTQINGSLVMSSDYVDNTASNFTTYYYVVTAVDLGANESTNSNEASATPEDTTPPAAPTNLAANPGDGSISLNWDDNGEGDLDGYNVHRATATGGPYTQINGSLVSSSDYVDNSVTNGTTYYYVVTAVDDTPNANESGNSNEDSATPEDQTPPAAPTNLAATPGDGSVSLNWDDNGEGDLDGYNVHRATSTGGPYTQLNGSLLTSSDYVDNSAVNFTTYYYVVTAVDNSPNANESGNSNEDSATPEDVTPPAAPTNLSAQGADGSVSLDWDDNGEGDLDGYNVHRATATGGPYTQINGSLVSVSAYTDNTASNGTTYYYVVTAVDDTPNANESNISNEASATPQAVAQIRIEAEDYDTGGEGVGYHDTTSGNTGGQYRSDDVDIETSTQGGYNVGWIAAGEWLQFSGISGSGQSYDIDVSVASASSGGEFHIEVNGVNVTGRVTFAATGGWQTWATIDAGTLTLPSGSNTIRFVMDTAGFNVDWFELNARDTGDTLDLDTLTMAGYGTQDVDTNAWELLDSGQILRLTGNTWKRFTVNYTVTADTVIEFDYKADANEPEIGGIVFDNDDTLSETQTWKVFGTQAYGNQEFDNYAFGGNGWTHYVIPVGQTLTAGSYSYLVLANDQDAGSGSNSSYRDVRIYENPTIIVDNDGGSPGFTTTGSWSTSGSSGYNGGSYVWANTGQSHTATWTFTLPESGDWEVEVIYRASTNRATSVEYEIDTSSGTQTAFVDQTQNNLVWVSLGTYAMDSGSTTVTLDSSGSSGGAVVIADAVRITRVP